VDAHRRLIRAVGPGRIRQFLRYSSVSVVSTIVGMTTLGVLVATRTLTPGWANVVATCAGTIPSFELNRRWVWQKTGSRSIVREVGPFCGLSFLGLALSTLAVAVTAAWADRHGVHPATRTFLVEAASVAAFGSIWLGQFVVLDRFLFRHHEPRSMLPADAGAANSSLEAA
jgi:putative flippase GtrA